MNLSNDIFLLNYSDCYRKNLLNCSVQKYTINSIILFQNIKVIKNHINR